MPSVLSSNSVNKTGVVVGEGKSRNWGRSRDTKEEFRHGNDRVAYSKKKKKKTKKLQPFSLFRVASHGTTETTLEI